MYKKQQLEILYCNANYYFPCSFALLSCSLLVGPSRFLVIAMFLVGRTGVDTIGDAAS